MAGFTACVFVVKEAYSQVWLWGGGLKVVAAQMSYGLPALEMTFVQVACSNMQCRACPCFCRKPLS